jgi:hypothetical protein
MMQRADAAMYEAKQHGRNSVSARLPEAAKLNGKQKGNFSLSGALAS